MNAAIDTPSTAIQAEKITIIASDGYPLTAYRYPARGEAKGNLLVAGGTGVPQRFYRRFAEYAAQRGLNVLTLDYRGASESSPASLKGFEMSYLDWSQKDLAAAVELLGQDDLPLYWVGHSFGGHAIGLLPNHQQLTACYTFGSGAGRLDAPGRGAEDPVVLEGDHAGDRVLEGLYGLEPAGHGR